MVGVAVGMVSCVGVELGLDEGVCVKVSVGVGLGVSVAVGVGVLVAVGDGVSVRDGVCVGVAVAVGVDVRVAVGVSVGGGSCPKPVLAADKSHIKPIIHPMRNSLRTILNYPLAATQHTNAAGRSLW